MKRVHFSQQHPLGYLPLRAGLGYLPETSLTSHPCPSCASKKNKSTCTICNGTGKVNLAPKTYTTRTHALNGKYVVIGGSRFKPFIIEPRIEFEIAKVWELNLRTAQIREHGSEWLWWEVGLLDQKDPLRPRYSFPELDIGIKGISFKTYTNILLSLNKNVTLDTIFYIHLLKPINSEEPQE